MSSPSKENQEPTAGEMAADNGPSASGGDSAASDGPRPPAKRPISNAVIEISDTESDDSDVCAVTSYQASADEVKRIRGADYSSSSSSSSDYSSDSDSGWEDDSIVIPDDFVSKKAVKKMLYPRANRMEDPKLNSKIQSQELIDRLKSHWQDCKDLKTEEVTLTSEPFRLCLLHNILSNPNIINNIVDDMNTLDWSRKKMDLFEFHQTMDLASLTWQRSIRGIYELLKTEVMDWVSKVTGTRLESVSASCSLYGPGDHLLVHDDRLSDRRVAFILYLAPWLPHDTPLENGGDNHVQDEAGAGAGGWSPRLGGALELFASDERGPTEPVHAVYPRNNMLAFFQVSNNSYHQVSEVLSMELPRLSINGWFHGPELEADRSEEPDEPLPDIVKPHNDVTVLSSLLSTAWQSARVRSGVQAQMERDSEVALHGLLAARTVRLLRPALDAPDVPWQRCGPANRRRYEVLPLEWVSRQEPQHPVRELVQMFSGSAFCRLLAECTDLSVTGYEALQLQRWTPGDYTLLPPREAYQSSRLEAAYYLEGREPATGAASPASPGRGGCTVFVAAEEAAGDAALALVPPRDNALALVYCEPGTARFTKYRSRLAAPPGDTFYLLTCTYRE